MANDKNVDKSVKSTTIHNHTTNVNKIVFNKKKRNLPLIISLVSIVGLSLTFGSYFISGDMPGEYTENFYKTTINGNDYILYTYNWFGEDSKFNKLQNLEPVFTTFETSYIGNRVNDVYLRVKHYYDIGLIKKFTTTKNNVVNGWQLNNVFDSDFSLRDIFSCQYFLKRKFSPVMRFFSYWNNILYFDDVAYYEYLNSIDRDNNSVIGVVYNVFISPLEWVSNAIYDLGVIIDFVVTW